MHSPAEHDHLTFSQKATRFGRHGPEGQASTGEDATPFAVGPDAWVPPAWFDRVRVVLVEPTDAVNIGGAARAMANTGFGRLSLVQPATVDAWDVLGVAHRTEHILQRCGIYDTLDSAIALDHLVVGFSGRHHRAARSVWALDAAVDQVERVARSGGRVALLFGREDGGLAEEALDRCNLVAAIPTNPAYPSLNLAQAVLLALYACFIRAHGDRQLPRVPRRHTALAPASLMEALFAEIEASLQATEFFKSRSRAGILRTLRIALKKANLTVREASVMRAAAIEVRRFMARAGTSNESPTEDG